MDVMDLRLKAEATQPGTVQDDVRTKGEDYAKAKTLAVQFEAMLMTQMLRQMKDSMAPESANEGLGGAVFGDTVNMELGMALTKAGGVGVAESLMKSLERLNEKPGQSEVEAAAASVGLPFNPPAVAMPLATGSGNPSGLPGAAISSDFGWRNDPIHGQQRFHAGLDLKVAYGQEVRAASSGVVKFAGEQGGYGTTVVVDHGDGLETRYAHLSSADVKVGAQVEAGQPIARSGNSGRSTGAHLHFEVRQDGQPIDPERVTGFFPVADLPGADRR